ncbi:MFS transporter [Nonomuraea sp. NPDC000554]|uniref:MFS transporter n=1 Tax=Nonomuraea sp. NPDC000554 TaxID=3154259 RepID=UPI00332F8200
MTITVERANWFAVSAVAVGTFSVVTSEMLPVGLLTSIGSGLGVSDGTAGLTMTAPGLVAAVAAPVLAVTARGVDRRTLLGALMLLLAAANLLTALAPDYWVMLAARLLVGVSIGGFWAFAAGLGVRLAPERSVGRATALISGGISVASVLGVPAGTFLAQLAGWRAAFAAVAVLALGVFAAIALTVPPLPAGPAVRLRDLGPVRVVMAVTALLVTGHFAAYTYVRPFLEQVSGAGAGLVTAALLLYGVAGVLGNFAAGARAARAPRRTLVTLAALIALATAALPLIGQPLPVLALWGVAYGGVSVSLQLWVIKAGGGDAAMAVFTSVFNAAISLGALLGGRIVDGISIPAVMWAGAALACVSAACAGIWGRSTTNGS